MTRTQSSFGVEFDSLADLISFGVAPAVITYRWALHESGFIGITVCFIYVLCGAVRLARFNVMARMGKSKNKSPDKYMLGLPIPMAAGFVVALVIAARAMGGWPWLTSYGLTVKGIGYPMMIVVMIALAALMVSAVKFRSFKDMKLNTFSISILAITALSSLLLWIKSKPAYILICLLCVYVALGFGEQVLSWSKKRRERS
jgi:CDP-diacylglycerol--serine O-phosphatidyltransferase